MPYLLQDKIKNMLIAPLILNKSQKRENRETSQRSQKPQDREQLERSENRREQRRKGKMNGGGGEQGNNNTGSRTTTNAFLAIGNLSNNRLTAIPEELGGFLSPTSLPDVQYKPFQEGNLGESWVAKTPEPFDWAENIFENSNGSQHILEPGSSDSGPGHGSSTEMTSNGWAGETDEHKKQELIHSTRNVPRFFAMDNDPQKAWTLVTFSKRSRKVKQAEQARHVEKGSGEKKGG